MPVGPYSTFDQCISAQVKKGKSKDSASAICGKIEKNTQQGLKRAETTTKYDDGFEHLYIKAFLLSSDVNINKWGVAPNSLDTNINSFIGKPLVLTENFRHPMPPEMDRVGSHDEFDNDSNPYNTVNIQEIVDHWLQYQEPYRVGTIIDISEKKGTYYAIIEVTDPHAKTAFRNNDLPLFVSPAIAQMDPFEDPSNIYNWQGVHLAIVSNPAYTIKRAIIAGQCHDEKERCVLQLRQAAVERAEKKLGCGFCRKAAFRKYAEAVKPYVGSVIQRIASTEEEFLNSSFGTLAASSNSELTDQKDNNNQNQNQQAQDFENKQKAQGGDLGEKQQEGNANPKQEVKATETKQTTEEKTVTKEAEVVGARVAGMEECVNIFQQNGVDPNQAMQICKLAAQALMENQQQQQQQGQGGGFGGRSQGSPSGAGKFGVIEYEKEITQKDLKIAELQDQLKTLKKDDKTDAQRIAELEETVNTLNTSLRSKEIESYLVTKIANEELRNKKIQRFIALNATLDDVKEIFEDTSKPTNTVKKTAEVQQNSPISRVPLKVASTEDGQGQQQTPQQNDLGQERLARNNKILSSILPNKRFN